MTPSFVTAFAPATVANVGPGFDAFGFALDGAGDRVTASRSDGLGVRLAAVAGDGGALPRDAKRNVVAVVAARMTRGLGLPFGVDLSLEKGLPLGSGLGSSSASAVAAAVAVNALIGRPYGSDELLEFARYGERVACGAAHADNVAPCLLGGFCIVRSYDPLEIVRLDAPPAWRVAVVHPHVDLPTRKARAALPKAVPLAAMAANAANAAALVVAFAKKDLGLAGRAIMAESVVTPARRRLIPGFMEAGRAAIHAGASGFSISGAGPSLFALTEGDRRARLIGAKMVAAWKRLGIAADPIVSRVGASGARIVGNGRS